MPATVQAVLAARIDRLPPEEKRLLQTAAVIGTEVPLALLAGHRRAARGGSCTAASATCRPPSSSTRRSLFPELEYTFKHALTHEVAYGSLLQERRRALHARIVEALETLVCRPAGRAGRNAWPTMPCGARCGTRPWRTAGRPGRRPWRARPSGRRWRTSSRRWRPSTHLPESRDTREQAIDLRLDLRNALFALGELGRILDHLREAEALAEALDDQRRLGRVAAYLSDYFRDMGDHDRAVASGQRALAIATALGDVALQVDGEPLPGSGLPYSWATIVRRCDCFRQNVESLAGALLRERFGMAGLPAVFSRAWLVRCLAELGAFAEGMCPWGRSAPDRRGGRSTMQPYRGAICGVGLLSLRQGDLPRAIPVLERGLEPLPGRVTSRSGSPESPAALGYAYALSGRVAEALPLLEQAVEQMPAMEPWAVRRSGRLSGRGLSAGRPPGGGDAARRACPGARP